MGSGRVPGEDKYEDQDYGGRAGENGRSNLDLPFGWEAVAAASIGRMLREASTTESPTNQEFHEVGHSRNIRNVRDNP